MGWWDTWGTLAIVGGSFVGTGVLVWVGLNVSWYLEQRARMGKELKDGK